MRTRTRDRTTPPRPAPAPAPGRHRAASPALALPALAFSALLVSLRGAPLGQPVADDWAFLAHQQFRPWDLFDSMGAAYYWRPLSRQLWYLAFSGAIQHAPLLMAAVHLGLLALLAALMARIARAFGASPLAAGVVACAPLAAEPARVLLAWPSGVQHLLAAVLAALALQRALAGRRVSASLAALGALGSHELAVLALAFLPFAFARGRAASARPGFVIALGAALLWVAGYALALRHGVQLPAGVGAAALSRLPLALAHVGANIVNLEGLPDAALPAVFGALCAITLLAAFALGFRRARPRPPAWRPAAALLVTALLATLPLAGLLPDWNAWRAFVPVVAAAAAIGWVLASVSSAAAIAFVLLRIATLALSPAAPALAREVPRAISDVSFPRLARMQRLSTGLHDALLAAHPSLPRGARVAYWSLPPYSEIAFQHGLALRVWYRDPSLGFGPFGGRETLAHLPDAVASFDLTGPEQHITLLAREALTAYYHALDALDRQDLSAADSLYQHSIALQHPVSATLSSKLLRNRALIALDQGRLDRADSLATMAERYTPEHQDGHAVAALIALRRHDLSTARVHINRCLALEPGNRIGQTALEEWRRATGAASGSR